MRSGSQEAEDHYHGLNYFRCMQNKVLAGMAMVALTSSCVHAPKQIDLSPLMAREVLMADGGSMLLSEAFGTRGVLLVAADPYCEPLPTLGTTLKAVISDLPSGYSLALYYPGRSLMDLTTVDKTDVDQLGLPQFLDSNCDLARSLGVQRALTACLVTKSGSLLFKGPVENGQGTVGLIEALRKIVDQDRAIGELPETGCRLKCDTPAVVN